jgi:glutamate---cysteine ligase / carboxylate-amine ligase
MLVDKAPCDVELSDLTIGIEEEYQIVDPVTRDLRSFITRFLEDGQMTLQEMIKPELHQSIIEVGTPVCHDVGAARRELVKLRAAIHDLASRSGLRIASAGTHPFAHWRDQEITPFPRYEGVVEDMQYLARRLLIFGLHVHVSVPSRELAIDTMNVLRYMLPHVLCLSTSSPFWMGQQTGLKSFRTTVFEDFPRTGIPDYFESRAAFDDYVGTLMGCGSIEDATKIWWDVRPHPKYPTLEFRICDACTRVDEAICVAALFQALVAKHVKLRRDNMTFRVYRRSLIVENKWRAVRYGLDGKLIDFGKSRQLPARDLIYELVDYVDDVLDELGSREAVEYAFKIVAGGASADRQLATFERTGSLEAVVDQLIAETLQGVDLSTTIDDVTFGQLRHDGSPVMKS